MFPSLQNTLQAIPKTIHTHTHTHTHCHRNVHWLCKSKTHFSKWMSEDCVPSTVSTVIYHILMICLQTRKSTTAVILRKWRTPAQLSACWCLRAQTPASGALLFMPLTEKGQRDWFSNTQSGHMSPEVPTPNLSALLVFCVSPEMSPQAHKPLSGSICKAHL